MKKTETSKLVPVDCYLHRVFPAGLYKESAEEIISRRLFKPRKDCENFELGNPVDWEALERASDRNWRMQLQGWAFLQPVLPYFDSYSQAHRESLQELVFKTVVDWVSVYGDDPNDIVTTRMPDSYAWYDMSVGYRALMVAFFCSRGLEQFLSKNTADLKVLNDFVDKHILHLSTPSVLYRNNHGLFQIHGLAALLQNSTEGMKHFHRMQYAEKAMLELLETQFSEDGIHLEHSPHYHFYVLDVFDNIMKSGWYQTEELQHRLDKATNVSKWLLDPNGRVVTVGDSLFSKPRRSVAVPTIGNSLISSTFEKSGYSVARTGWGCEPDESAFIFMTGAHHSNVHKHRDCLSFEWQVGGLRVLCDSGKYGYHSDEYRRYALSARAHNVLEIDGFDVLKMSPIGSMLSPSYIEDGIAYLSGFRGYKAFQHEREIISEPKRWLVIIDEVNQQRSKPVTQWLHFGENFNEFKDLGEYCVVEGEHPVQVLIQSFGSKSSIEFFKADTESMNGFLFMRDDIVDTGIAMAIRSVGENPTTKFLTVISLDEGAHQDALEFAEKHQMNAV